MLRTLTIFAVLFAFAARAQEHVHGAATSDKDAKVPAHQNHPLDKDAPKPQGEMVDVKVGAETSKAYLAKPKGKPAGAVLVIHEWWGLNDWVKHMADELAALGYTAL